MGSIVKVKVSVRYKKSFERLPLRVQKKAVLMMNVFRINPFDQKLKTHPLSGKNQECWSFWINYSYRIKFIFLSKSKVLFLDIGTHEIYR